MLRVNERAKVGISRKAFGSLGAVCLALLASLDLATGTYVHAETAPTRQWVARYDGPLHLTDNFSAVYAGILYAFFPFVEPTFKLMAVDGSGNIYVAGAILTENLYDIVTVKYNKANGSIAWQKTYDRGLAVSELPAGIDLDKDGNVYVTGVTGTEEVSSDVVTLKYRGTDGALLWDRVYDGPHQFLDGATGLVVDKQNNVYVCGYTAYLDPLTKLPRFDYLTLKYSGTGIYRWAKTYDGPHKFRDIATALALDSANNLYVTGASASNSLATQFDIVTIKYAPAGTVTWKKTYDGPGGIFDVGRDIAVDSSGMVYVTGESDIGSVQAMVTLKYDQVATHNDPVWVSAYEDPTGDFFSLGKALVLDASGKAYAAGDVLGDSGYDYLVIKYNPATGQPVWAKTHNGPAADGNDQARSIATDSAGNVYVTGSSMGTAGNEDIATVKFGSAKGGKLWSVRYNNSAVKDYDGGVAVAVSPDNRVYVAGESMGKGTDLDLAVIRYNQAP